MKMWTRYRVTRTVAKDEPGNYADREVAEGEVFAEFGGCSYGSCDVDNGVVLENERGAFFEFPRDAVEQVQ